MTIAIALILGGCIGSALTFVWVGICEMNQEPPERPQQQFIDPEGEG